MTSGLVIWAAQFTIFYGATAVACARGYGTWELFGIPVVSLAMAVATIAALVSVALIVVRAWRRQRQLRAAGADSTDRFLASSTFLIGVLSLVAIAWTGLPALLLPGCG